MKYIFTTLLLCIFTLSANCQHKAKPKSSNDTIQTMKIAKNFSINIDYMDPMGYDASTVDGYNVTLSNDTVNMYLPYVGEVYQADFNNDGLNMVKPIYNYNATPGKEGSTEVTFCCKRDFVEYKFHIVLYPDGTVYVDLQPSNAQSISYSGELQ